MQVTRRGHVASGADFCPQALQEVEGVNVVCWAVFCETSKHVHLLFLVLERRAVVDAGREVTLCPHLHPRLQRAVEHVDVVGERVGRAVDFCRPAYNRYFCGCRLLCCGADFGPRTHTGRVYLTPLPQTSGVQLKDLGGHVGRVRGQTAQSNSAPRLQRHRAKVCVEAGVDTRWCLHFDHTPCRCHTLAFFVCFVLFCFV